MLNSYEFSVHEEAHFTYSRTKAYMKRKISSEAYVNCLNKLYNITGEKTYLEEIKKIRYKEYFELIEKFKELG
ncbi:MAG: hypothetical protein M0R46_00665 [Candidatus Muirbacterium halophilum]|nr:hypothetical protein [Candidatus Muirbacterium halophilum]MCK9474406.1 hypothetical protein [Candidatus Muirbacterium halophilum]